MSAFCRALARDGESCSLTLLPEQQAVLALEGTELEDVTEAGGVRTASWTRLTLLATGLRANAGSYSERRSVTATGYPLVFEAIEAKVPHATDSHPDVQVGRERQLFSRREEVGSHVAERLAALAAVSGEAPASEELLDLGSYESLFTGLVQVPVVSNASDTVVVFIALVVSRTSRMVLPPHVDWLASTQA